MRFPNDQSSLIRTAILAAMAASGCWVGGARGQDYNFTPTTGSYSNASPGIWVNDSGMPLSSPPPYNAVVSTNFGSTDSTGASLSIYNPVRDYASVDLGALQIGSLGANVTLGDGGAGMNLYLGGSSVTAVSSIAAGRGLTMNFGTSLLGTAVSGGGAPTLSNAGTILMAGANNIAGFSLTNSGMINAAGGGGFVGGLGYPPTVVTNTGGTIMVGNGQQFVIVSSTVTGGTLEAGSNGTGTGKFYIGGLPSGNSSNTTLSDLTIQANATIAGPSAAVVNFDNVHYISGATQLNGLQLTGATLNLSGVNTFDLGGFNRMQMLNDPTNSGGIVLQSGSTFYLNGQLQSGIAASAPGMISGSGTIASTPGSTYSGIIYNNYGTIAATTGDITLGNYIGVSGGTLTQSGGHAFQIVGGASLNDLTVTSGTVINVKSSGSLSVDGGGMTLNGTLNNAAGTYGNNFGTSFASSVTGTGSLINSGNIASYGGINLASVQNSGAITFLGNTSLSGSVENSNGVITVAGGNIAHGQLTIANGLDGGALLAANGDVLFAGGTVSNVALEAYPANNSVLEVTANTTFTNDQFLFGSS